MGSAKLPATSEEPGVCLETEESRPQSLCLQLMNANIDRYAVEAGQTVHVKFDCSARQWRTGGSIP